jgi:hypothetical protein
MHHRSLGDQLTSVNLISDDGAISVIALFRARGEGEFSSRAHRLLSFFHEELGRLIGRSLVSGTEARPDQLSPRQTVRIFHGSSLVATHARSLQPFASSIRPIARADAGLAGPGAEPGVARSRTHGVCRRRHGRWPMSAVVHAKQRTASGRGAPGNVAGCAPHS